MAGKVIFKIELKSWSYYLNFNRHQGDHKVIFNRPAEILTAVVDCVTVNLCPYSCHDVAEKVLILS
jgi:hypothetical protein